MPESAQADLEVEPFRERLGQCIDETFDNIIACLDNIGGFIVHLNEKGYAKVYPDVLEDLEALENELLDIHYKIKLKVDPRDI